MNFISKNEQQTQQIGFEFAKKIEKATCKTIIITGKMGTGKTAFVRGFSSYFSVSDCCSPTFNIVNEYFGQEKIIHFDLDRISGVDELYEIGFEDYFEQNAIIIIEWGEKAKKLLSKGFHEVQIRQIDEETREFIIYEHISN